MLVAPYRARWTVETMRDEVHLLALAVCFIRAAAANCPEIFQTKTTTIDTMHSNFLYCFFLISSPYKLYVVWIWRFRIRWKRRKPLTRETCSARAEYDRAAMKLLAQSFMTLPGANFLAVNNTKGPSTVDTHCILTATFPQKLIMPTNLWFIKAG